MRTLSDNCLHLLVIVLWTNLYIVSESDKYFYHSRLKGFKRTIVPGYLNGVAPEFYLLNKTTNPDTYTDLYVFQITNYTVEMKNLIRAEGLKFIRKVFQDDDYYLFRLSNRRCRRCRRSAEGFMKEMIERSSVKWASQQISLERVHRSRIEEPVGVVSRRLLRHSSKAIRDLDFNDPLFKQQWYLVNEGQLAGSSPGLDLNVLSAWSTGVTGKGVRIAVLDDGVHPLSEEVAPNYDPISSGDYSYPNSKQLPIKENSHGTYCAAIAAGVANNNVCGVGIAFHAKVGGVRLLNGDVTDAQEAMALVHALDYVDIYTASWGPKDDGKHVAGPGPLARMSFHKGITQGRGGKGAIYVWAAGNGGRHGDNCNLDGYASSPYTLTFGALAADGRSSYYSEPCAAVLAGVYVGGSHRPPKDLQKEREKIKVIVPEGQGKCRSTFQGTSAAAPLAAGALALALQANPELTWRDVQHLVILTSRAPSALLQGEEGWGVNGAGLRFHPKVGFGALDAGALVAAARGWRPVGPLLQWTSGPIYDGRSVHSNLHIWVPGRPSDIGRLETVTATLTSRHRTPVTLRSPSGTTSVLLTADDERRVMDWDFVSLHFWGEDPQGEWTLEGVIETVSLRLEGTAG